jgi:hypothetical protein
MQIFADTLIGGDLFVLLLLLLTVITPLSLPHRNRNHGALYDISLLDGFMEE